MYHYSKFFLGFEWMNVFPMYRYIYIYINARKKLNDLIL